MKRIWLHLLIAVMTFSLGVLTWLVKPYKSIVSHIPPINTPTQFLCPSDTFTVKAQPDANMQLVVVQANCSGSSWNARLTLQNLGPKAVRGYQIGNIEDYDYKKGVESGQGVMAVTGGVVMAPGETKTLNFGAGFQNGLSYGKPTGAILRNVFWIEKIEYSDGTSWHQQR